MENIFIETVMCMKVYIFLCRIVWIWVKKWTW